MSDLSEDKKLIWLGLKRASGDTSEVAGAIDKLLNNVADYSTFQSELDSYDLGGDGTTEDISDYSQFKTYLQEHGFSSDEADRFINRIKSNFDDEDSSGSTYDEFEEYVENEASSFAELKNAFGSNQSFESEQRVAGVKLFENDGYTKDGVFAPAGSIEMYGNEIHFSQTGPPASAEENISYKNLSVSKTTPVLNQTTEISADIENTGSARGSVFAPLIEDGNVVTRKEVEIAAGATETVTFKRSYDELQSIEVTIKDLTSQTVTVIPQGLN